MLYRAFRSDREFQRTSVMRAPRGVRYLYLLQRIDDLVKVGSTANPTRRCRAIAGFKRNVVRIVIAGPTKRWRMLENAMVAYLHRTSHRQTFFIEYAQLTPEAIERIIQFLKSGFRQSFPGECLYLRGLLTFAIHNRGLPKLKRNLKTT